MMVYHVACSECYPMSQLVLHGVLGADIMSDGLYITTGQRSYSRVGGAANFSKLSGSSCCNILGISTGAEWYIG